jgi:BolA family transcriptional regulator, general stress-responsive regulator
MTEPKEPTPNATRPAPDEIVARLRRDLAAEHVEIEDESHRHAGHPGARGGGHFNVVVVSERFEGLSRVARHRAIYEVLADQLGGGSIHALSAKALTPAEWRGR